MGQKIIRTDILDTKIFSMGGVASDNLGEGPNIEFYDNQTGNGSLVQLNGDAGLDIYNGVEFQYTKTASINKDGDITAKSFIGSGASLTGIIKSQINGLENIDNTSDENKPVSLAVRSILDGLDGNGVNDGLYLSINTDNTKFDISVGHYHKIMDGDVYVNVPKLAITPQYLTTHNATYIALDSSGNVIQKSSNFTPDERRIYIILGSVIHSNHTNINTVNNTPDVSVSLLSQYNDLLDGLNQFNKSGNLISANGSNLFINKSAGKIFKRGVNFINNYNNPHLKDMAALTAPSTLRYRLANGTEYSDTQSIDKYYELAGVRTIVPNNRFTIQRVVLFPSNLIRIQYGTAIYNTMALAEQGIKSEQFVLESNMAENGLLIAFIIVKGSATALNVTSDFLVVSTDRFGQLPVGSGGGATSLQQAYENSGVPKIVTNTTNNGIEIQVGSASNADKAFKIKNIAGTINTAIDGNGLLSTTTALIGTSTNNTSFEADGTLKMNGTATVFDDLTSDITRAKTVGTRVTFNDTEMTMDFTSSSVLTDYIVMSYQLSHKWKVGSTIFPHIHWEQAASQTPNWMIQYRWQKQGQVKTTAWTNYKMNTNTFTYTSGTLNQISYSGGITPPSGSSLSDIIEIRIIRDSNNSTGLFTSVDAYSGTVSITSADIHYEIDTLGSRTEYTK